MENSELLHQNHNLVVSVVVVVDLDKVLEVHFEKVD